MKAKREYPLGVRLILALGKDTGRYGSGTPTAEVILEVVENRDGQVMICGDTLSDRWPEDHYYNWMDARERHYLLSWANTVRRRAYDDLGYNTRMGLGSRVEAQQALRMAKTLTRIEKGIQKAQETTGTACTTFDGYLENLLPALKPTFLIVRDGSGVEKAMRPAEILVAYHVLTEQIEQHFQQAITAYEAGTAAVMPG